MADVLVLANDVSMPIKVAWILWLTWSILQVGWYRRGRIAVPVSQPAPYARLERPRVEPPRYRAASATAPIPPAPGDVMATASDATPPANRAKTTIQLESEKVAP